MAWLYGYGTQTARCSLIQSIAPVAVPHPLKPPPLLWHFVRFQFDVQQSVKLFNRILCIINLCAAESPAFSRPFSVLSHIRAI